MSKFIKASIPALLAGGCTLRHTDDGKLQVTVPDSMGSFVVSLYPDRLVVGTHVQRPAGWVQEELTKQKIRFVIEEDAESLPGPLPAHPIQPLMTDTLGVVRFKPNGIVDALLDFAKGYGYDLNAIVADPDFSREDLVQFYQLIGYSLSGYGDLNAVSNTDYNAAEFMQDNPEASETQARLQVAESTLAELRHLMATPIASLYGIHEDDLKDGRP